MPPPLPRRSVWTYRFAHFIQTYQSSPIGLSGRPAHCPFRGLLGVHSRCGLHTRAVTNLRHANRRLQPLRYLHDCSDCFRLERLPGGACTPWKAPPLHGAHPKQTLPPDGSRTLLHNRITIGGQVQKNSLGDVCALIWCYPFIVQVRTTVALRIVNEGTVDGTDNQVFNCGRRHLTSQSLAHE